MEKELKIAFDARWIKQTPDGISTFSRHLVKELALKTELTLLISDKAQLMDLPELPCLMVNSPHSPREMLLSFKLNHKNFDIVFSPHYLFGGWGRKFKLVLTVHDLIPFEFKTWRPSLSGLFWGIFYSSGFFLKLLLKNADLIVAVSQTTAAELSKLTKKRIEVVYNAPELQTVDQTEPHKQLIYVGRFEAYKNVETLIKAINKLPEYRLVLVGPIDGKRKKQLTDEGKRLEFTGAIREDELAARLKQSAALVTASQAEGFGIPVINAMQSGVPVICSDIPIFREVAGDCALYFDPDSAESLVAGVRKLESQPERDRIINCGKKNVERFSWQASAAKLLSLLSSTI